MITEAEFLKDVETHIMEVIRDDGVQRHIRFRAPGTMCMHFDLITWPGYLCYTGDMGTYVFRRLHDMFEFFRTDRDYAKRRGVRLAVNLSYWGEKLEAQDRDGFRKFCPDKFRANIMRWIEDHGWTGKLGHGLRDELESDVLEMADYGAERAYEAAGDFKYDGKYVFPDFWEVDSDEYVHRFVWCCFALAWGIEQYDAQAVAAPVMEAKSHE